jgi:hypothetical protein
MDTVFAGMGTGTVWENPTCSILMASPTQNNNFDGVASPIASFKFTLNSL